MRVIECRIPGGRGLDGFIPQHLSSSSPIAPVPLPSCRPHTCTPAVLMTGSCITYRDDCRTSIHPQTALHPQLVLHLYLLLPLLLMNFSKTAQRTPWGHLLHFPNYSSLGPLFFVHILCHYTLVLMCCHPSPATGHELFEDGCCMALAPDTQETLGPHGSFSLFTTRSLTCAQSRLHSPAPSHLPSIRSLQQPREEIQDHREEVASSRSHSPGRVSCPRIST